ncbi:hypothetical protein P8X24_10995 [Pyrococcus kukulkanii]|uniref:hypothetical protein n=1 Tax=Pyrococcus kukulkanii TaxID=1609559 RepID=UPI00356A1BAD
MGRGKIVVVVVLVAIVVGVLFALRKPSEPKVGAQILGVEVEGDSVVFTLNSTPPRKVLFNGRPVEFEVQNTTVRFSAPYSLLGRVNKITLEFPSGNATLTYITPEVELRAFVSFPGKPLALTGSFSCGNVSVGGSVVSFTGRARAPGECSFEAVGLFEHPLVQVDAGALSVVSPQLAGELAGLSKVIHTLKVEKVVRAFKIPLEDWDYYIYPPARSGGLVGYAYDFSNVTPGAVGTLFKRGLVEAVNPDGKALCVPGLSGCQGLAGPQGGLPIIVPEEGDKGHHVMHVEVPLYLDEGEYIIVTSFTWEDKDDKNGDKHEFIISVKDEDGYSLAESPAIEEKEAGTTGSPFQVSYPMQVKANTRGKYRVVIDVYQTQDAGPKEKALILNKILILKMPEAPATMAIDIPSLFTEVDLDNLNTRNLIEGIAYVEPTKDIYLYNKTEAFIRAEDNIISVISPNRTALEYVPTSFVPDYTIDWLGYYDVVGGRQAGYAFDAVVLRRGLAGVSAVYKDGGIFSYDPRLEVTVTFGPSSLAYYYAVGWFASATNAELPSWYDRLTLRAYDYVSSMSYTVGGLEIESLYESSVKFTLEPTEQVVAGDTTDFSEALYFVVGLKDYSEPYDYKTGSVEWGILLKNVRRGADYLVAMLRRADTGVIVGYWTYPLPSNCNPCNILLSLDGLTDRGELLNFIGHKYVLTVSGVVRGR